MNFKGSVYWGIGNSIRGQWAPTKSKPRAGGGKYRTSWNLFKTRGEMTHLELPCNPSRLHNFTFDSRIGEFVSSGPLRATQERAEQKTVRAKKNLSVPDRDMMHTISLECLKKQFRRQQLIYFFDATDEETTGTGGAPAGLLPAPRAAVFVGAISAGINL